MIYFVNSYFPFINIRKLNQKERERERAREGERERERERETEAQEYKVKLRGRYMGDKHMNGDHLHVSAE